jgi:hypothetical protein
LTHLTIEGDANLDEARDFLARWQDAWADPASGRLADLWADHGEMLHPELHDPIVGGPAVMDYLRLALAAMPDMRVEGLAAAASGANLFVHWRARATVRGRPMSWEGMDRFELEDGRAVRGIGVFDTAPLREAFGDVGSLEDAAAG